MTWHLGFCNMSACLREREGSSSRSVDGCTWLRPRRASGATGPCGGPALLLWQRQRPQSRKHAVAVELQRRPEALRLLEGVLGFVIASQRSENPPACIKRLGEASQLQGGVHVGQGKLELAGLELDPGSSVGVVGVLGV